MLYKLTTILISFYLLTSCAGNTQPPNPDGIFSTEYVPARKEQSLSGAKEYCLSKQKDFKILSTDCAWRCVTIFQCVEGN
tara:strand:+ start:425 stop:664 length:240 start_codon:yes stop_codon:yes gene_type:complete